MLNKLVWQQMHPLMIQRLRCRNFLLHFLIQNCHQVAAAAAENVKVWNLKTGDRMLTLISGERHEVSCIAVNQNGQTLAAGYEDGSLRLFDLESGNQRIFRD